MAAIEVPSIELIPSQEETMLRETVAGICSGFGPEDTRRKVEAGEPPTGLWDALAERGYLGVNVPEEYDGGGLGMSGLAAVGEEISAAGCALLLIVVSPAIVGSVLARHGTPEQKERWLRGIGRGTTKFAFAITEPDAGSNSHNLATAAKRDSPSRGAGNGKWIVRGQKTFISGVEEADAILVVARVREPDGSLGLPLLLIVDTDAPGLERQHIPTVLPPSDKQWQLFFDDVEVDADRLPGGNKNPRLKAGFHGAQPARV